VHRFILTHRFAGLGIWPGAGATVTALERPTETGKFSRSIQLNLVSVEIYKCKMLDFSKHGEDEVKVEQFMAPGSSKSATVAAPEAKVVRQAFQAQHPRMAEQKDGQ